MKEKTLTTNCDKDNIKPLKEKSLSDKFFKRVGLPSTIDKREFIDVKQFIKEVLEDIDWAMKESGGLYSNIESVDPVEYMAHLIENRIKQKAGDKLI